ncbi:CopG family transcriptional regulator, partial [Shewanella sp.]
AMSSSSLQHSLSLDEFIEAANLYAMGQSLNKLKSNLDHKADATVTKTTDTTDMARSHSNVLSLHKQSLETDVLFPAKVETKTHYRKATFSLSEAAITHLATLAEESSISKSKLLRLLIEQHFDLPIALRQLREQQRQHR